MQTIVVFLPQLCNFYFAVCFQGYDMEDAMIINKSSYERGFAYGCIYKSYVRYVIALLLPITMYFVFVQVSFETSFSICYHLCLHFLFI
jgi:hypothetical protein